MERRGTRITPHNQSYRGSTSARPPSHLESNLSTNQPTSPFGKLEARREQNNEKRKRSPQKEKSRNEKLQVGVSPGGLEFEF